MSEANNSSWPFSELPEAEGLNFDKILYLKMLIYLLSLAR